jgi:putative ABC transport system ATP-binding protein
MTLVRAEGLTRSFGSVDALRDVDFRIERGEWIGIMGPSGSGKTTLLNLLGGLDVPTAGRVLFDGRDLSTLTSAELAVFRRENVGFVFQQFHLVPYLTALENVMLAQYLHSMADEPAARRALEGVGLGDRLDHLPAQLSGGEQQRVCVARALINQPKMILADEPTGNLDQDNAERLIELFSDLHRAGHTLVMVTHDPDLGKLAERRFDLHHGALTGVARSSREEEELFDDVLQQIWERTETGAAENECADGPSLLGNRRLLALMQARGLIEPGAETSLSPAGRERARVVIRRHRLAERLFQDTFALRENDQIEANACLLEHVLSPEVTESICRFLKHPRTCPHERPIPAGVCCS